MTPSQVAYYGQPYSPGNAHYESDRLQYEAWVKIHNSPERQAELKECYPDGNVRLMPWYFHEKLEEDRKTIDRLAQNELH